MKTATKGYIETFITVRFQFEGFHKWKDAPDNVAFLKNIHRHMFKCEASIQVFHDDRELEFFTVLDMIRVKILPFIQLGNGNESCETMAKHIMRGLINVYGAHRRYRTSVSEDGENQATVIYKLNEPW